jgi:lysophospholipase L1-like esterase
MPLRVHLSRSIDMESMMSKSGLPQKSLSLLTCTRWVACLALGWILLAAPAAFAFDEHGGDWVGTWGASPQSEIEPAFGPPPTPVQFNNQTIRMIARISKGGDRIRVRLDNSFGTNPVVIGAAHVAVHASGVRIVPGSDHQLTFGGNVTVTIPPGAPIVSDPVDFDIPNLAELAVSIYLPQTTAGLSGHTLGVQTTFVAAPGSGDQTGAVAVPTPTTTLIRYFLAGIDVLAGDEVKAVVTFGDSITDGFNSTVDANRRWPDRLAERLLERRQTQDLTVVNEGISGNRLLHNVIGPDALSRFDRDVISQAHVQFVTVLLGINDVGFPAISVPNSPPPFASQSVTSDQMIQAYRQLITRAHAKGIKIIGATLTPFEGAGYATAAGEAKRQAANNFIRSSGEFDAVIDFDRVTRDPTHPTRLAPQFDSGDHLHPNDAGYKAMADSIDLSIFQQHRR